MASVTYSPKKDLPYSLDEYAVDLVNELGPEDAAMLALKLLALGLINGPLEMHTLVQFAMGVQRDADKISRHFRDAGARAGSFALPRA